MNKIESALSFFTPLGPTVIVKNGTFETHRQRFVHPPGTEIPIDFRLEFDGESGGEEMSLTETHVKPIGTFTVIDPQGASVV